MPNIVVLDAMTLGSDLSFKALRELGSCTVWPLTAQEQIPERIENADIVIGNKCRLIPEVLEGASRLKLILMTGTGYDNIDTDYCRERGIGVCNVRNYSTDSVAQLTVSLVLELVHHLSFFRDYTASGAYTESGVGNLLEPAFFELRDKTWGIVGAGNIGHQVARIAESFGCRILVFQRHPDPFYTTVSLSKLCVESDIITLHTPLTKETAGLVGDPQLFLMKKGVILVNMARGAVLDEAAAADAVLSGKLGGFGCDVFSREPFPPGHPYQAIKDLPNVILTPHIGWAALEARQRVIDETAENIRSFLEGGFRNRVE